MTVVEDAYGKYSLINDRGVEISGGFDTNAEAWKWLDDNFEPAPVPYQYYSADGVTVMDGLTRKRASWWKRLARRIAA